MKKTVLALALILMGFAACVNTDQSQSSQTTFGAGGLALLTDANPGWQYENLRLYPITADARLAQEQASLAALKTLAEGMNTQGFRIMERKQFGREEETWFNGLTVQNKSQDTVFIMSGDVVTGGNQDRVIAYDDVIPPGTVKNIAVFCVEAGRSSYYDPAAPEAEKQVAAFKGYYNVASPAVRKAVHSGNQGSVWSEVSKVTLANGAHSNTSAYAALDTENEKKEKREAYLRFFDEKIETLPNVVGIVAVCNGQVAGVDVFGHPDLFRRQYKSLLHGYVAEAVTATDQQSVSNETVQQAFKRVSLLAAPALKSTDGAGKFAWNGQWVHLFEK